ncbi:MAG TPA: ribosome biogenesis GTPase Der, partial [Sphingomicrobium sp.]|nr:ribosome biogenesis GTPase Der [Sphingomicrobium sp.]
MPLPTVAIVGRPNVGKSTLFNRLVGKKLALVDDQPGVTRDRREGEARLLGLEFRVFDTAGYEDEDPHTLPGRMRAQTQAAVRDADVALLLIDAREGVTPLDAEIARWLRAGETPVVVVANKAESRAAEAGILDTYRLGLGDPVPLSAEHGEGVVDLFEALRPLVEREEEEEAPEDEDSAAPLKLAIMGRPNAGKSTLVNQMLGEERLITGPEAGITRDAITLDWEWQGKPVRIVDTAGLRKRAKITEKLEKLSSADARRAMEHAEVVILLLDATRGLEAQDLRIAELVIEEGRALIIAVNKWDVAENASSLFNGIKAALEEGLAQIKNIPVLTVSAKTGKGIDELLRVAFELREQWSRRVPTGELNRWFEAAVEANSPPAPGGKRIKLRYITQVKSRPPSFVVFGTRVDHLPESYRRYLMNSMRRELGLGPVPLRMT